MSIFGGALGGVVGGAVVRLTLDKSQFDAGLRQARGETEAGATGMGKFAGAAKAGFALAGLAALKFGADSVKAFSESQQIGAQTTAVLRSTGGAANVTADDVESLANEIRNLSGIDDEAVQASENLLLTFRDIHNEAGKGNDIFNQTTLAIADMATAMNQGAIPSQEQLAQTTIQVGKAMNDPIKGMTALRRVGVAFSDSQVQVITRMQESGDLMGAQKLILQELTTEFGGAAEAAGNTFAGSMAKAKNKVDDLKEAIGGFLASALLALTGDLGGAARLWTEVSEGTAGATQHFYDLAAAMTAADAAVAGVGVTLALAQAQPTLDWIDRLAAAMDAGAGAADRAAFADAGLAAAMQKLNDQMRTAWSLENQLAGGLVGLAAADADATQKRRELAAAQAKVNTLVENGKKGTHAYAQAVRDRNAAEITSLQSQQNLEGSAQSLYAEFRKGNVSLAEAEDRLRAQARAAGDSEARTNALVAMVDALYKSDNKLPSDVITNYLANGLAGNLADLARYNQYLVGLNGKQVYITVHTNYVETGARPHGGIQ